MTVTINKDSIVKAIKMKVFYVKQWGDKVRCFGDRMGYGEHVDLTEEEYQLYQDVIAVDEETLLAKLDKLLE